MIRARLLGWLGRHARADRNSVTVTIASPQAGRTFQIDLPRWSLRVLGGVLVAGFALVVAGGILYGKLIRDALVLREIRRENVVLRKRSEQMQAIEADVAQLQRVRRQLYQLAGIPEGEATAGSQENEAPTNDLRHDPEATGDMLPSAAGTPLRDVPFRGPVSRGFTNGRGWAPEHLGVDVAGPEGAPVVAAADGEVAFAGWDSTFGNMIIINHLNGWTTRYGHNQAVMVREGDTVRAGQSIAQVGNTGKSSAPHLHFEILKDGIPLNPAQFFRAYESADGETAPAGN